MLIKMENKKAQVTIFIIIAVIIIAGVSLFFLNSSKDSDYKYEDISSFEIFVNNCFQETSEEAILFIGENGGYYYLPLNNISDLVAVHIDVNKNLVPDKITLEKEISKYIEDSINICFDDFQEFEEQGFNITYRNITKINTDIQSNQININGEIYLIISREDSTSIINEFSATVQPIRMPEILKIINEIAEEQIQDPRSVCITCLSDKAEEYNISIEVLKIENTNEFTYVIVDSLSNFYNEPYEFRFGARYNFPDCESTEECFDAMS